MDMRIVTLLTELAHRRQFVAHTVRAVRNKFGNRSAYLNIKQRARCSGMPIPVVCFIHIRLRVDVIPLGLSLCQVQIAAFWSSTDYKYVNCNGPNGRALRL